MADDDSPARGTPPERVVIAGAGIVGLSSAFYLAQNHGLRDLTVVDVTGTVAPAASGQAAGFLARDWNDDRALRKLQRRSFRLHQELADRLGADRIQYRRLPRVAFVGLEDGEGGERGEKGRTKKQRRKTKLEWVDSNTNISSVQIIDSDAVNDDDDDKNNLAQVHPKMLCESLWEATKNLAKEAKLVKGRVVGSEHDQNGKLIGVKLQDGRVLSADALLYACGPWTADIVKGSKGHSVVLPVDQIYRESVFFTDHEGNNFEGFMRPNQTVYCSGVPEESVTVTEQPGEETPTPQSIEFIISGMKRCLGSRLDPARSSAFLEGRACYQPTTPDDLPIMGPLEKKGCYVAVGHSCWGITLGPATGEIMADLMATGRKSNAHVTLRPFLPKRFKAPLLMVPV